MGTFMNLSFECDNVERTYAELRKKSVEFEKPPTKQYWGNYAILKDQDGNRLLISAGEA